MSVLFFGIFFLVASFDKIKCSQKRNFARFQKTYEPSHNTQAYIYTHVHTQVDGGGGLESLLGEMDALFGEDGATTTSGMNKTKHKRKSTMIGAHGGMSVYEGSEYQGEEDPNKLYCICRKPYDASDFMVCCDECDEW